MIQKPRGTQDIFGQEAKEYQGLEKLIFQVLKKYNFQEMRTPIFEAKELFVRSVGQSTDVVAKEMYEFVDKKGREFVLRPEGTAPIVRALIENKLYPSTNWPLKIYYYGPMFRYERPQTGRNRQFEQIGVEVFGPHTPDQDLEILALITSIAQALKIEKKVQLELNFLVTGAEREKYIIDLKTYLNTFSGLCGDCQKRMKTNPLRVLDCKIDGHKFKEAPDMNQYLSPEQQKDWEEILSRTKTFGLKTVVNPKLVRGLDYYTGLIFELKYLSSTLGSQATIIAGGRYNNLVKSLNGPETPAIGFAMGVERLLIVAQENRLPLIKESGIDVYTIALTKEAQIFNQKLLFDLRTTGLIVDTDYLHRSLTSAFKQAEKWKAKNVLIIGEQEMSKKVVTVKNQKTKKEATVTWDKLAKFLKEKE